MSVNLNAVIIGGRLTRDPEIRTLSSGSVVADVGMAIDDSYKNKNGEKVDRTIFVDCTAFGKTAEFVEKYFRKGSAAIVEGGLKFEQWEADDGTRRSKLGVMIRNITFGESMADKEAREGGGDRQNRGGNGGRRDQRGERGAEYGSRGERRSGGQETRNSGPGQDVSRNYEASPPAGTDDDLPY